MRIADEVTMTMTDIRAQLARLDLERQVLADHSLPSTPSHLERLRTIRNNLLRLSLLPELEAK